MLGLLLTRSLMRNGYGVRSPRISLLAVALLGAVYAPAKTLAAGALTTQLVADGLSQPVFVTAPQSDRERR